MRIVFYRDAYILRLANKVKFEKPRSEHSHNPEKGARLFLVKKGWWVSGGWVLGVLKSGGRVFRPLLNVNFRWVCSEIEAVGGRICVRFAASLQALFLTQYRQDLPFCGTQMESPKFSFGAAAYIKIFLPRLRRSSRKKEK